MLYLMLLVGGLFVLGILCGEQARAADGAASAPVVTGPVTGGAHDVVRPVTEQAVRPVTGLVVPPAAEHVVRPVGELVDQIADGLVGGIAGQPVPPSEPPDLPALPDLPTLPDPPTLPDFPGLPGLPEVPESPLPEVPARTLPAGTAAPRQPGGAADGHQEAERQAAGRRAAEKQSAGTPARGGSGASVFGPRFAGGPGATGDVVRHHAPTRAAGVTRMAQAPVHQVPDGDLSGALRNHSAVDSGSPRHGDQQALTPNEGTRPAPAPGTAADLTAAATRDRHRDVPASPG